MKFAIVEITDGSETIIGNCSSEDELISILSNEYEYVLTTAGRPNGKYIIKTNNKYELVDKTTETATSLLFGSSTIEINNTIKSWKLIRIKEKMPNTNEINNFEFSSVFKNFSASLIIGNCGVGKTSMIKKMLNLMDESFLNNSMIINSNEYKNEYPNMTSIEEWNDSDIDDYFVNVGNNPGVIIIEDTPKYGNKLNKYTLESMIYNFRYYNKHLIFVCQHPKILPPPLRKQFTNIFIFKYNAKYTTEFIYKNFCDMFNSYEQFISVFDELTNDYNCIVVNNVSKKIFKCINSV